MYVINYESSDLIETAETLKEAMEIANAHAHYCQTTITITKDEGEKWERIWYGIPPYMDCKPSLAIKFGMGYGEWIKIK